MTTLSTIGTIPVQRLPSPYRDEQLIVQSCLSQLAGKLDWAAASQLATPWVQAVRQNPPPFWAMESLLKEFPISSNEGLALMRLAEALLRIPDSETAVALTADQLSTADFDSSANGSGSALQVSFSRLSQAAMQLSKKMLPSDANEPAGLMTRFGSKAVVAASLRAMQLLGRQFVLGQTIVDAQLQARADAKAQSKMADSALVTGASGQVNALCFSYDMLGEGARTMADAQRYWQAYSNALTAIAKSVSGRAIDPRHSDGLSIKLSALYPRFDYAQQADVLQHLLPSLWILVEQAAAANVNLTIDAEEVERLELSLDIVEAIIKKIAVQYPHWHGFGLAIQAYQTRALDLIEHVIATARQHSVQLMCRLVKGAYWDAEIKRAQEMGLEHYPVFTHKEHTDISYLACAQNLLKAQDVIYAQFASHNAGTIAAIILMAKQTNAAFELQRLHGMGEGVYREVLATQNVRCRVYAPVGPHRDLLAYLVRRLLENGANSSFVHQMADDGLAIADLLESPLVFNPAVALPLPANLFNNEIGRYRLNSYGVDLSVVSTQTVMAKALAQSSLATVPDRALEDIEPAVQAALAAYKQWSRVNVQDRSQCLLAAADLLQERLPAFAALLVKEAFKTWGDAVSEVREAIDFLRYYALEAPALMADKVLPGPTGETNVLRLRARGVWVCISPWNFPLAIFIGQVSAALVTGNTVLAKPAEQTPAIAKAAIDLLVECGVPAEAIQCCAGQGETIGAALVAHKNIAGVVFTGSTLVAKLINRNLAAKDGPITPLIAETGGVNAMVVDSSALPEQVVDAVIQSAFRSAGQRCSALRLLCIHHAIAESVIDMIQGAASQLKTGDSALLQTDVGPLIDADAKSLVIQAIVKLEAQGAKRLLPTLQNDLMASGNAVLPSAFELKSIDQVRDEIFGPVLQVVRWGANGETAFDVVEAINRLGYGLTMGIQTRIDSRAQALAMAAHAGNVYINRNTIGAVVGVQPFGGEGLSGTGPKAGGPHYLLRFCSEQTVTVNTTAAGGNATLLAG